MISPDDYRLLRQMDDFSHLTADQFDDLVEQVQHRKVQKGHTLFFSHDKRQSLFLVTEGYCRIEQTDQTASFIYTDFVAPRTLLPYDGLFTQDPYPFSVIALTSLSFFVIPTALYERLVTNNSEQFQQLYRKTTDLMAWQRLRLQNTVVSSASMRVTQVLGLLYYRLCQQSQQLPFALTSQELALMCGTTRETVSRVLTDLKKKAIIRIDKRRLYYLNTDYFTDYLP